MVCHCVCTVSHSCGSGAQKQNSEGSLASRLHVYIFSSNGYFYISSLCFQVFKSKGLITFKEGKIFSDFKRKVRIIKLQYCS